MAAKRRGSKRAPASTEKAKKILSDGTIHGKPLSKKQKGFFGRIAGGATRVRV